MAQVLPANPNLDWLRKTARQRLAEMRSGQPDARLHQAQVAIANDYGFASWRALKAHVDGITSAFRSREHVFDAARAGDVETVRKAFAAGFDPLTPDADSRTIYQIAKERRHEAIELLVRNTPRGTTQSEDEVQALRSIVGAAQSGDIAALRAHLGTHPNLIDALSGDGFKKATALHLAALRNQHDAVRLLIERGADVDSRDFPDNAAPLHFAAVHGDLETIKLLVEAGADVNGNGDDYELGVLGWATCFRQVREDVAAYLLSHGAQMNLWTAIALERADDVRARIIREPSLLHARMTRNHHRRRPLHHAAAKNRREMVRLLLRLGADPNASDATGGTALTTASQEHADPAIIDDLLAAGARLDFPTAVNLGRYGEAEMMLRQDPSRIGTDGRDTIALHLAVSRKNLTTIRWLLDHGADVNARRPMWDCNHTALHMAIENGAMEIAHLLLDAGADPNIRDDKYHATALGWAEFFGSGDLMSLMRDRGGRS